MATVLWAVAEDAASRRLIIRLITQTVRRDRSGSVGVDQAPDLSRPDPSRADQIDVEHRLRMGWFRFGPLQRGGELQGSSVGSLNGSTAMPNGGSSVMSLCSTSRSSKARTAASS